jgi:dihydrofolate reductase
MIPPLSLVVALADNGVIGRDNQLVWRLRTDLRRFKALTLGRPMIMGRKTFASIGKPLPGRETIVLTRNPDALRAVEDPALHIVTTLEEALALAERRAEAMGADSIPVVGGAEIYRLTLPLIARMYLTIVHASPEGDNHFPAFDRSAFRETLREDYPAGEGDEYAFTCVDLERI